VTKRGTATKPAESRPWSYIAGEKGQNRVRVFERACKGRRAAIWIDFNDAQERRVRQPLGHCERERAKLEADDIAARFRRHEARSPGAATLQTLIDTYLDEVTPTKSASPQSHDRRTFALFAKAFGAHRRASTLNRRDWDSYIRRRRRGELAPPGREGKRARARVLEQDCRLLLALLNWAERSGDGRGGYLLAKNPLTGLAVPREESPRRAVLTPEQFEAVRKAAIGIGSSAECFVVLAWYTGHRAASIRQLRWSDIDLERGRIHWRGEVDKIGYDHWNPLRPEAVQMLERERALAELTGASTDAWVFPSLRDRAAPMPRPTCCDLWRQLASAAGLPTGEGYGRHSLRRAFANCLRAAPLRDLKELGGWTTEKTVVSVYQGRSEEAQRAALGAFDRA
jgi:integrase